MKQNKSMVYLSLAIFLLGIFSFSFILNEKNTEFDEVFKTTSSQDNVSYKEKPDIKPQPFCGDGTCDYEVGENAMNCPEDCYV